MSKREKIKNFIVLFLFTESTTTAKPKNEISIYVYEISFGSYATINHNRNFSKPSSTSSIAAILTRPHEILMVFLLAR